MRTEVLLGEGNCEILWNEKKLVGVLSVNLLKVYSLHFVALTYFTPLQFVENRLMQMFLYTEMQFVFRGYAMDKDQFYTNKVTAFKHSW